LKPLDRLKFIVQESGTTRAALRKILDCSQPLVSQIMNGERELTKDHIRKLGRHFAVSPAVFL
jgi:antitoxin component HigA of HigAB toxin-antitoxin module